MPSIEDRVSALGLSLPQANPPVANYRTHRRVGTLVAFSGQIPQGYSHQGRLGAELDADAGYAAARSAALALAAHISAATNGDAEGVAAIVQLRVFIATTADFVSHSRVADGASDLLTAVFGVNGEHARTAFGVASLPAGAAVEIDALIELVD